MLKISSPYLYQNSIERVNINGKRHYKISDYHIPSVTTILDKTSDKSGLESWKQWKGEEEANRIVTEAVNLGTLLHTHIESWISGVFRPSGNNLIKKMSYNMSNVIIAKGLHKVNEVWGLEKNLWNDMWAGTSDLIGVYQNEPAIMDFKTTNKPKQEKYIEGYYMQLCAYALAHNHLYNTRIQKGVIFMVSRSYDYQEFVLEGTKWNYYQEKWLKAVDTYYELA